MSNEIKQLWYASYGSNLLESRFHCYIQGGQPKGSQKKHLGCANKTLPQKNKSVLINHELYFAKESKGWGNGGVGFIKTEVDEAARTLGRMYLVTTEQFIEIVKQENNYKGELKLDFNKVIENGSLLIHQDTWYGNLLYLGEENSIPIFTFTNEKNLTKEINQPSKEYLSTIINGLKESYHLNEIEIVEYFKNKAGIKGSKIEKELIELIKLE